MRELEKEREESSGIKWKVKTKKRRGWNPMSMCVVDKMQEKKKGGKCMDERNAKNKKSQFKNTTTIFSQ